MIIKNHNINKHLIWYSLGVVVPMFFLMLRSPIYTRIYSPEIYGKYTLVYVSYTLLSTVFFQWISSSAWRYFTKYKMAGRLNVFFRVIQRLYFLSSFILFIITLEWFINSEDKGQRILIIYGFLYALSQEYINTALIPMRITEKSGLYNLIASSRAIISFGLLLLLTFVLQYGIVSFFIAPLIVNGFILILLFIYSIKNKSHKEKVKYFRAHQYRFFRYGLSTLVYNAGLFLLLSGDRYIIQFYEGFEKLGIYNQTYNIAQLSIAAIFTAINAAFNPLLISNLDQKPNKSDGKLSGAFNYALYIALPITILFSFFSKDIAGIFLGTEFREAYQIMPLIFGSALINGLCHFASLKIKFKNSLRVLTQIALGAALLNILSTIVFVKLMGYQSAAFTSIASYLVMMFLLYYHAKLNPFKDKLNRKRFLWIMLSTILIVLVHLYIRINSVEVFSNDLINAVLEGIFLIILYLIVSYKISPLKPGNFADIK